MNRSEFASAPRTHTATHTHTHTHTHKLPHIVRVIRYGESRQATSESAYYQSGTRDAQSAVIPGRDNRLGYLSGPHILTGGLRPSRAGHGLRVQVAAGPGSGSLPSLPAPGEWLQGATLASRGAAERPRGTSLRHVPAARPCGTSPRHVLAARPCGTSLRQPCGTSLRQAHPSRRRLIYGEANLGYQ